jgi:site-specific DNA-methyltransferase (adenine-specific)
MWDGEPLGGPLERNLDAYDVLVRRNEAVGILDKVRSFRVNGEPEATLDSRVSTQKPFGLRTFFHGADAPTGMADPIKLHGSQKVSWIERAEIPRNSEWVDDWKVLMSRVQGTSAAVETQFLGRPVIAGPKEACTESYVVAGRFSSKAKAARYAAYLRTRFARFLVSLRKSTQDAARDVYGFIPDIPLDRTWTDAELYKRYGLTSDEIAFLESQVKEMPGTGSTK